MSSYKYQPYSVETEREIYQKWLKKCEEESMLNRQKNEQNIFRKIQSDRDLLNRLGNIPPVESDKISSPEYMPRQIPVSHSASTIPLYENKYTHYTLDGFPRKNFKEFYVPPQQMNGYGISRGSTDVTNSEIYDKINNLTYDEYKEKQKEFLNFNQHTINDNMRYKDYLFNEKRRINEERLKEIQRLRELEYQERLFQNEKKKVYKELLDDQLKVKIPSKLGQEYYNPNLKDRAIRFINPQLYLTTPENSFMNRNRLVEINPYSLKKTELGTTTLEHNPILNPVFNYKYNKYLFPQTESSLQRVGYEVAK